MVPNPKTYTSSFPFSEFLIWGYAMKFEVEYMTHPLEIPFGSSLILTFSKLAGRALDYAVSRKKKRKKA